MKDNKIPSPLVSLLPVFVLILLLFVTIRTFAVSYTHLIFCLTEVRGVVQLLQYNQLCTCCRHLFYICLLYTSIQG